MHHSNASVSLASISRVPIFVFPFHFTCISLDLPPVEHHHKEPAGYSYLKIRNKPFPWQCSDCGFFESECHTACQEKLAAMKA